MGILAAGNTDIGRKRKSNQDAFAIDMQNRFFIVADGMGGHNGGDIASQMAIKTFSEFMRNNLDVDPKILIANAIRKTNHEIKNYAIAHPELAGMGTTIVSTYIHGQNLYIGNVGDSRAYLINSNKIYQLSRDHSLVQEKLNYGIYTREQAALDPQKNVLVKTVGFDDEVDPDVFTYKIIKNDIFIICSDGLHGKVSDEDILFIINKYIPNPATATSSDVEIVVQNLIKLANENGGQDNITVIVIIAQ